MGELVLRDDEKIGLGAAVALHAALAGVLAMQAVRSDVAVFPGRMTVSLATEVGLESTSPDPVSESRASTSPTLGDNPAPAPEPQATRPEPAARATTQPPKQVPKTTAPPTAARERSRPDRTPAKQAAATQTKPATKPPTTQPKSTGKTGGGSLFDQAFAEGAGSSTTTKETRMPASQIGASAKASLLQQISRRIRPHWQPPSGPEAEKLSTFLRFRLNPDGSLAGRPEVVRQTGVTDLNRAQASRHAELAIRSVQRAAPFDLPDQYYEAWKVVGPLEFNWELSQ